MSRWTIHILTWSWRSLCTDFQQLPLVRSNGPGGPTRVHRQERIILFENYSIKMQRSIFNEFSRTVDFEVYNLIQRMCLFTDTWTMPALLSACLRMPPTDRYTDETHVYSLAHHPPLKCNNFAEPCRWRMSAGPSVHRSVDHLLQTRWCICIVCIVWNPHRFRKAAADVCSRTLCLFCSLTHRSAGNTTLFRSTTKYVWY